MAYPRATELVSWALPLGTLGVVGMIACSDATSGDVTSETPGQSSGRTSGKSGGSSGGQSGAKTSGRSGGGASGTGSSGSSGGSGRSDAGVDTGTDAGIKKTAPTLPAEPGNLTLDTTADSSITTELYYNHIGYEQWGSKQAVVASSGPLSRFQVVRKTDGKVLGAGNLVVASGFTEWGAKTFSVVDFSSVVWPGTYRLLVNGKYSETFEIGPHILVERTLDAVLGYFKASRADDADVWAADANVPVFGSSTRRNAQGGWYDAAGDISKYFSHLSYANFLNPQQIPLVTWALAWVRDRGGSLVTSRDAALRDEAQWGADFLLRMLDDQGFFYVTVFDNWSGRLEARELCAFEGSGGAKTADYKAAFREGAGVAIAALARTARWGTASPYTGYLAGAKKAFAHLQEHGPEYCDDKKENIIDDYAALLAATELYAATTDAAYLTAARARAQSLGKRLSPSGYFIADDGSRPFWHASDAGLPMVALAEYLGVETDAAARAAARETMTNHLKYLVQTTNEVANPFGYARQHFTYNSKVQSGFFIPHENETNYWWQGENARLGSLSAAAIVGGRAVGLPDSGNMGVPADLATFASNQLDWVLGKNPFDICFLDGFGRNNPPAYCGAKSQGGQLKGGIANGVTGSDPDGKGISFTAGAGDNCWESWRWTEQWLPHSTWYLIGSVALGVPAWE